MLNPRFNDVQELIEAGNYEAAGEAFGMILNEQTDGDYQEEDIALFCEALHGETA